MSYNGWVYTLVAVATVLVSWSFYSWNGRIDVGIVWVYIGAGAAIAGLLRKRGRD